MVLLEVSWDVLSRRTVGSRVTYLRLQLTEDVLESKGLFSVCTSVEGEEGEE